MLSTLKLIYLAWSDRVHLPFLEGILQQSDVPRVCFQQVELFESSSLPLIGRSDSVFVLVIDALLRLLRHYVPVTLRAQRTWPFGSASVCRYAGFFKGSLLRRHIAKSR